MRIPPRALAAFAVLVGTLFCAQRSYGQGITVFTDRAAWNNALAGGSPTSLVDFESFTSDVFNTTLGGSTIADVGPFSVIHTTCNVCLDDTNGIDVPPLVGGAGIDFTTAHLRLSVDNSTRFTDLTYDAPFSAWAADFSGALGPSGMGVQIEFLTSSGAQIVPIPQDDGFIGFVAPGESITSVTLRRQNAVNVIEGYALDNVSAGVAAIPEPSSIFLAGIAVVGLMGYEWRRRKLAASRVRRSSP